MSWLTDCMPTPNAADTLLLGPADAAWCSGSNLPTTDSLDAVNPGATSPHRPPSTQLMLMMRGAWVRIVRS